MQPAQGPSYANHLLAALPDAELSILRPHLVRTTFVNAQTLHEPGERVDQVYFFEHGFASAVAIADDGAAAEIGLIGRESMVGLGIVLSPAPFAYAWNMVQLPGAGYRMPASALAVALDRMPVLHRLLLQELEVMFAQVAQTAACNSRHTLAQRCARWLLLAHDRVDGDELRLTQEFLSLMLAVRRSGVTVAMQALQAAGAVQSGRGRILVCDRAVLEGASCNCYGRVGQFAERVRNDVRVA